ncbi:Insulin-like growth factor binding protein, N-terminal [Pseudocohnilembus persalinus]|uniref:Insulin-like growth factor binding protein, N-terminal n=1 Tax=Pseudocohnilembus persalinus TaxID=266149 RepID=A0A0V0QW01_PSEPJ|nr:Insulin-like growth factor binding protein, N-terminal [Pseudocohnilembus persalinus]|eukprot:KRX06120.1 Insulin-like growth factor binding protein, N-terminal [Pseudocohnilembus persalinus]
MNLVNPTEPDCCPKKFHNNQKFLTLNYLETKEKFLKCINCLTEIEQQDFETLKGNISIDQIISNQFQSINNWPPIQDQNLKEKIIKIIDNAKEDDLIKFQNNCLKKIDVFFQQLTKKTYEYINKLKKENIQQIQELFNQQISCHKIINLKQIYQLEDLKEKITLFHKKQINIDQLYLTIQNKKKSLKSDQQLKYYLNKTEQAQQQILNKIQEIKEQNSNLFPFISLNLDENFQKTQKISQNQALKNNLIDNQQKYGNLPYLTQIFEYPDRKNTYINPNLKYNWNQNFKISDFGFNENYIKIFNESEENNTNIQFNQQFNSPKQVYARIPNYFSTSVLKIKLEGRIPQLLFGIGDLAKKDSHLHQFNYIGIYKESYGSKNELNQILNNSIYNLLQKGQNEFIIEFDLFRKILKIYDGEKQQQKLHINNPQPIRITYDSSYLTENLASNDYQLHMQNLLEISILFFQNQIQVQRENEALIFGNQTCFDFTPQNSDKNTGILNSDLHLYVSYYEDPASTTILNGAACLLSILKNSNFYQNLQATIHELTHILGFSKNLIQYWINPETNQSYGSGNEPIISQTIRSISTQILTTENVQEAAKKHYACESLIGMQLENQDNSTLIGSHWEKTILQNDVMTSSQHTGNLIFSNITFALLNDTGWYLAKPLHLETSFWGKNKGCSFTTTCNYSYQEFNNSASNTCNFDFTGSGPSFQDSYTDNCYTINLSTNCQNPDNNSGIESLQYGTNYGLQSRCFMSNVINKNYISSGYKPKCVQFSCDSENNLFVYFNNQSYLCDETEGCNIQITGSNTLYRGKIKPMGDFDTFCNNYNTPCYNRCNQNGYCQNNQCFCLPNYAGTYCSVYCPNGFVYDGICYEENTCPQFSKLNPYTKECEKVCSYKCGSCEDAQNQPEICSTCSDSNRDPVPDCDCLDGYYDDGEENPECKECLSPCSTCITKEDNCTSCINQYFLIDSDCLSCQTLLGENCITCLNKENCQICSDGYYLQDGNCLECNFPCKKCQSATECLDCEDNYFFNEFQCKTCNQWIENCNICVSYDQCTQCDQYYYLEQLNKCTLCQAPCLECETENNCNSCIQNYFLGINECKTCQDWIPNCQQCTNYQQCEKCQDGYYYENQQCQKCQSPCINCSSIETCLSCIDNYFLGNGICQQCENWISHCINCQDYQTCLTCEDKFENQINKCQIICDSPCTQQCELNYFLNDGECFLCQNQIENCNQCQNQDNCTLCQDNFYLNDLNKCSSCISPCVNCISDGECTSCISEYYLDNYNLLVQTAFQTVNVHLYPCLNCENSVDNCTECINTDNRKNAPDCTCLDQFYDDGEFCQNCQSPCLLCDQISNCLSCIENYYLNDQGECKQCKNYIENCKLCENYQECIECEPGYYLQNNICIPCVSPCETCIDGENCLTCVENYILGETMCKLCENWVMHCETCLDYKTCEICDSDYDITVNGKCTKCGYPCLECTISECTV